MPAIHPEPVTIQVLDGKGGAPLAHVHLQFVAGYDAADLRRGLWSGEAVTDGHGRAILPNSLKDFSYVEVRVAKHKLCAPHGHSASFILDRVRHEGSSTLNYCGTTLVEDAPGVLHVFAKAHPKDLLPPPSLPAMRAVCAVKRRKR